MVAIKASHLLRRHQTWSLPMSLPRWRAAHHIKTRIPWGQSHDSNLLFSPRASLPFSTCPSIDLQDIEPEPVQGAPSIIRLSGLSPPWTPRPPPSCRPTHLRTGGQLSLEWLCSACCFPPLWSACGCGPGRRLSTRWAGMTMPVLPAWYAITGPSFTFTC
jgi:hypothetical protein